MALVNPKRFTLSPGIVDFAKGKNNLIPPKNVSCSSDVLAKSFEDQPLDNGFGGGEVESDSGDNGLESYIYSAEEQDDLSNLPFENNGDEDLAQTEQTQFSGEPLNQDEVEVGGGGQSDIEDETANDSLSEVDNQTTDSDLSEENFEPLTGVEESDNNVYEEFFELSDMIEQGKAILLQMESEITYLYEGYFANRGFAYTLNQVIVNFEEYLQSLLLVACMTERDLAEDEMRFIWCVLSRADIFTGMNSIEQTLEKAQKIMETTPHAIMITVAVDKFYDKTKTCLVVDGIYQLYILICKLGGIVPIEKYKLLEKIKQFAKAQGVKL